MDCNQLLLLVLSFKSFEVVELILFCRLRAKTILPRGKETGIKRLSFEGVLDEVFLGHFLVDAGFLGNLKSPEHG